MEHLNQPVPSNVTLVARADAPIQGGIYPGNPYGFENDSDDSEGGLLEYWRILRRNSRAIALSSLAGLIIGFAIGIPMRPVFRAKTSLEVLTINDDFMNMKQANPTTTNDNNYDTSEEQTQAKLLESSVLLNRVAYKLGHNQRPAKPTMAASGWRALLHLPQSVQLSEREKLLVAAAKSLKVRPTARTRVLEITVDSTDPQLATDFANTMTQEFMALNVEARWSTTQRTGEWLRRELDDARTKLRQSEDVLQTYARSSGLIFTDESTNVATEKLQQVQQALSAATAERIAKQSRFELAQNSPPESLADVLNDAALRDIQSKINDLKRQIADLSAVYSAEYSKVRRMQAELESLQSAFNNSRTDILNRIKTDFQECSRKEKLLAIAYDAQAHEVTGQDEKAIQYNILKRDVDSNRQLYDAMLQQMKQSSIASAMHSSNVRVVDPAEVPETAISPNFPMNSALGFLGGLFLSIALVTIRERADRTLQQPGDIKTWLDLPELGTIPSSSLESRRVSHVSRSTPTLDATAEALNFPVHQREWSARPSTSNVELVTLQKKPSLVAEAFRSVLTSILFMGENDRRPRVLVFTSANAADGKTTVASNVAIAAAEIRYRVLVIDADLRRPRMHNIFNVPNDVGLTDLLQGEASEAALAGAIKATAISCLEVLPAGSPTNAAAHMLYSPNLAAIVTSLRAKYDMIIIDTPPMLQMTDARVTGRLADAVILVARAGQTTRDAVLAARDRLREDRTTILGAVLNDWNPKLSPGGYYGYYRGGSYHQYQNGYGKN